MVMMRPQQVEVGQMMISQPVVVEQRMKERMISELVVGQWYVEMVVKGKKVGVKEKEKVREKVRGMQSVMEKVKRLGVDWIQTEIVML